MKIIYTLTPQPGMRNVGDQAQAVCIHRWLARHWPGVEVREFHKKDPIVVIAWSVQPGDLIFIHSGGNMCNRAMSLSEPARRAVVRAFPDNRIVSLPQTIGLTGAALEGAKDVYNAHRDLMIIGRDPVSYGLAVEHFGLDAPRRRAALCPDFALGYPYEPPARERRGVLFALRTDRESIYGKEGRAPLAAQHGGTLGDTNAEARITPERREEELLLKLDEFAGYEAVVTDRLHGVIFSILSGTPVVVLPTVDHKLSASWGWFKDMPQVVFSEGRDLGECMDEARDCSEFVHPDWEGEWFAPLAGRLQGRRPAFDLPATIRGRRSRRQWSPRAVPHELLLDLIRAGVDAPSGSNAQCVRFMPITDAADIRSICRAKHHHGFKDNHPAAIILVGYDFGVPGTILYKTKPSRWMPLAYQDVAAAMQNMALAAESVGLAACWVSMFTGKVLLELPYAGDVEWISALFVGWPSRPWIAEPTHQRHRIARREVSHYLVQ